MEQKKLIECVPNFSEGRDPAVIRQITDVIESVEGVRLLDVDPGRATHRTVVTFVGEPEPVAEAAFRAIAKAKTLIDMRKHKGEHPRMGATDVCPLIPVSNITMEETVQWARKLGARVGDELGIPVFMYGDAASEEVRKNLATVRAGEYEGLEKKLADHRWSPDFGPATFLPKTGATAIGARDFLVAFNVNLNTTSVRRANSVAFDVREQGRVQRAGDGITGEILRDADGNPVRQTGMCKAVKAIGWYIEEYGIAQISMNLTDLNVTPMHIAFEACRRSAADRGLRVTGSELVGLVPLKVMLDAGRYFLHRQNRSTGISEREIVRIAIRSMGLDELSPFDPDKKIIEYLLQDDSNTPLARMSLGGFAESVASESPTPGGGSVAAYAGALGAALGAMVANLSSHKRGWDDRWETFSQWAEKGQEIKEQLLVLVDADTAAFNDVMAAFRLPKDTEDDIRVRNAQIQGATLQAIEIPLQVMRTATQAWPLLHAMVDEGNPASVTDAAVGALCIRAAIRGAELNVLINLSGLDDKTAAETMRTEAEGIGSAAAEHEAALFDRLSKKL